jgi:hypothetical protein
MLNDKILRLIGLMSVQFNILERDFKYLLICLRDDLPVTDARKTAFKFKNFSELLCEARKRLSSRALTGKYEEIIDEADDLRQTAQLNAG